MDKIVLSAKIKKCEIIEGKIEFEKLTLSSDECKQIKIWHEYGDSLQVSLEPIQQEMFKEKPKEEKKEESKKKKSVA